MLSYIILVPGMPYVFSYYHNDLSPTIVPIILVVLFALPVGCFFIVRKSITKMGNAVIEGDTLTFQLDNKKTVIPLHEIKRYRILRFRGVFVTLNLQNGKKFKLAANDNFCDAIPMVAFSYELEELLQRYQQEHGGIVRQKNMFESNWMLWLLITGTLTLSGIFISGWVSGKKIPVTLYSSFALLIPLWMAYWNARKKT